MSDTSTSAGDERYKDLPPYMRIATDGVLELVLHPTRGQTWNVCQMKHQLRYGWLIERAQPRPALNYGLAVHAALAHRYSNLDWSLADLEPQQMGLLDQHFEAHPQPDDEWRNLGRAQQAISAYNERWPAHDWTVLAVEEGAPSELPAAEPHPLDMIVGHINTDKPVEASIPDVVRVILRTRKDLVVVQNGQLWMVDHKTASDWGEDPDKNQNILGDRRSFQFRAQAWHERELHRLTAIEAANHGDLLGDHVEQRYNAPVRGVIANYIIGRRNFSDNPAYAARRSATPKPRDEFVQWSYPFTNAALDEWRDEALALAREMVWAWQHQTWRQAFDRSCAHYGRCEYYDYCDADPSDRESVLSSSLYQGVGENAAADSE